MHGRLRAHIIGSVVVRSKEYCTKTSLKVYIIHAYASPRSRSLIFRTLLLLLLLLFTEGVASPSEPRRHESRLKKYVLWTNAVFLLARFSTKTYLSVKRYKNLCGTILVCSSGDVCSGAIEHLTGKTLRFYAFENTHKSIALHKDYCSYNGWP